MTTDKTPATLAVDVLAVMARDAASAFEARHGDREIQEFLGKESDAARAEVAELIEVAAAVSSACVSNYGNATELHLALAASGGLNERLATALARVKGESA